MSSGNILNVRQVSEILLVSERHVTALIREGKFPNAKRPGRGWLIPRKDVHNYIKENNK